MIEQIKVIFAEMKLRTVVLIVGILLTFGLIAAAAPRLPRNAENIVTQPRPPRGPRGNGPRGADRRGENGRQNRPLPIGDFFDF